MIIKINQDDIYKEIYFLDDIDEQMEDQNEEEEEEEEEEVVDDEYDKKLKKYEHDKLKEMNESKNILFLRNQENFI